MPLTKQLGQVGELAESAPLLRACILTGTEGSNPSLSATTTPLILFNIISGLIINYSIVRMYLI